MKTYAEIEAFLHEKLKDKFIESIDANARTFADLVDKYIDEMVPKRPSPLVPMIRLGLKHLKNYLAIDALIFQRSMPCRTGDRPCESGITHLKVPPMKQTGSLP